MLLVLYNSLAYQPIALYHSKVHGTICPLACGGQDTSDVSIKAV